MSTHLEVRPGAYHDSVSLMQVSRAAQEVDGVEAALVAMATELNREFLGPMGFDADVEAGPNDLLVAVRARRGRPGRPGGRRGRAGRIQSRRVGRVRRRRPAAHHRRRPAA